VHTRDLDRALAVAGELRAGMVRVNAPTTGVDLHAPFGGEGHSGYGPREQGRAADALFTVERTITVRPSA
jgi:aldehyde dehydrogenase (NAD+)